MMLIQPLILQMVTHVWLLNVIQVELLNVIQVKLECQATIVVLD